MSNLEAIDTNIILRLILGDNPTHKQKARNLLLSGREFYVDDLAITETVYVLEGEGKSREAIVHHLTTLLSNDMLHYHADIFAEVFPVYATHPSLSFSDCYLAAKIASLDHEPLWTFDHKFATQSPTAKELK